MNFEPNEKFENIFEESLVGILGIQQNFIVKETTESTKAKEQVETPRKSSIKTNKPSQ